MGTKAGIRDCQKQLKNGSARLKQQQRLQHFGKRESTRLPPLSIHSHSDYVCVCMCVCVRERERVRVFDRYCVCV